MTTPTITPDTTVTTTDLSSQVATVIAAMQTLRDSLPPDDSLATPREQEQNFVRRSTLGTLASRLRVELQQLQELQPKLVFTTAWISTLKSALADLEPRLAAEEDKGDRDTRAFRLTDGLRQSLRTLHSGPENLAGNEFLTDILADWFAQHDVTPLPGERGIFTGRGGLYSALAHVDWLNLEIGKARDEVERTLTTAKNLLA